MSMEKKIRIYKSIFLLCIVLSFTVQFYYILQIHLELALLKKIILFIIQMLSIVGYTYFKIYHKNKDYQKKIIMKTKWIVFIIYCFNLLYILFLDPDFGRMMINDSLSFQDYLKNNVNIHLFDSIHLFIRGYQMGIVSLETMLRNLLGNMVIFMPMAYFLPALFPSQRQFICFLPTLFMIVLSLEFLQVILRIGSGDIDDLFLNVIGGCIMYICLLIKRKGKS